MNTDDTLPSCLTYLSRMSTIISFKRCKLPIKLGYVLMLLCLINVSINHITSFVSFSCNRQSPMLNRQYSINPPASFEQPSLSDDHYKLQKITVTKNCELEILDSEDSSPHNNKIICQPDLCKTFTIKVTVNSVPRELLFDSFKYTNTNEETAATYAFWHGESNNGSALNYYQDKHGNVFGSIVDVTGEKIWHYRLMGNEVIGKAISSLSKDYVDEDADTGSDDVESTADSAGFDQQDSLEAPSEAPTSNYDSCRNLDCENDSVASEYYGLDVMVVWTTRAECENAYWSNQNENDDCAVQNTIPTIRDGILNDTTKLKMEGLINLAVEETNTAFELSGVKTKLNLVHSYRSDKIDEYDNQGNLKTLKNHFDAGTRNHNDYQDIRVNQMNYGADIVVIIVGRSNICGIAPNKIIDASRTIAWVKYDCATGHFSFGHEIGHTLGLRHHRGGPDSCCFEGSKSCYEYNPYFYGFRDKEKKIRTIQSYPCTTLNCLVKIECEEYNEACLEEGGSSNVDQCPIRIQRFSNTNEESFRMNGEQVTIGSNTADTARYLNEN